MYNRQKGFIALIAKATNICFRGPSSTTQDTPQKLERANLQTSSITEPHVQARLQPILAVYSF